MKKIRIIFFIAAALFFAGCDGQKPAETAKENAERIQDNIQKVEQSRIILLQSVQQLVDANVLDANTAAKIISNESKYFPILPTITAAANAVKDINLTGNQLQDLINQALAANEATRQINPWTDKISSILEAVLAITTLVGILFGKKMYDKKVDAEKETDDLTVTAAAIVKAIEQLPEVASKEIKLQVASNLRDKDAYLMGKTIISDLKSA